jgi:hypothetical protein
VTTYRSRGPSDSVQESDKRGISPADSGYTECFPDRRPLRPPTRRGTTAPDRSVLAGLSAARSGAGGGRGAGHGGGGAPIPASRPWPQRRPTLAAGTCRARHRRRRPEPQRRNVTGTGAADPRGASERGSVLATKYKTGLRGVYSQAGPWRDAEAILLVNGRSCHRPLSREATTGWASVPRGRIA